MPLIFSLLLACGPEPAPCPLWFTDLDGDGFGAGEGVASCAALSGRTLEEGDCEDRDSSVYPGAIDVPLDGVDQDCDGADLCQDARVVRTMEDVDCALGMHNVGDSAESWPEGDCICAISGDLSLDDADIGPQRNLVHIKGDMTLVWLDGEVTGAFENLSEVDGALNLELGVDLDLPRLRRSPEVWLRGDGEVSVNMPALAQVDGLHMEGGVSLDAARIYALETLWMSGQPQDTLTAPALQWVNSLNLYGGTLDAPGLALVDTATLQAQVSLPGLAQVDTLKVEAGAQVDLAGLDTVSLIEASGALRADKLTWLPRLNHRAGAETTLEALEEVDFLHVEGELELPRLETVRLLQVESGGALTLPILTTVNDLRVVESVLHAPLLTEVSLLYVKESARGDFDVPKLSSAGNLYVGSDTLFPALRVVDRLEVREQTEAPVLEEVGDLSAFAPLDAPKLRSAETVLLLGQGHSLPDLRWLGTLRTEDCEAFGALRRIDAWIFSSCDLDLRGLSSFSGPLMLYPLGVATHFTLPDPLPTALWLDGVNYGSLNQQTVEGALSLQVRASAPPEDFYLRKVQGQLYLNLDTATGLGSLTQLEEVGGDVSYCAPAVPEAEMQSWLASIQVGGSVLNRCP